MKTLLKFLPLFIIYIIVVLAFSSNELIGDEPRHISYATNLSNGFFAETDNPSLRIGPAYPIVILVPVILNASYDLIRLLNVPFLLIAIVFLYRTLRYYIKPKTATVLAYIFGLYPPILKYISYIYTEAFALMLICGFLYYFIRINKEDIKRRKHIILAASFLGLLVLTKVIFGYVVIAAILFYLTLYIFKKSEQKKNVLFVLVVGFMFAIPYLIYTYKVTEKPFLWGTQGGAILYWRSTPFENEFGNWISMDDVLESQTSEKYKNTELYANHGAFIQQLVPLTYVERDAVFKEKAVENIKNHPSSYIKNTFANTLRLFFNYPYSYTPQKVSTYVYILPNMFLVVLILFALFIGIKNRKTLSFEIGFLSLISFIFIGGLCLLDGRVRHLIPVIPILIFIIAILCHQSIRIQFISSDSENQIQ